MLPLAGDRGAAPALGALAERSGLSPWQLHRLFKQATGLTPKAYAKAHRARALRQALQPGQSDSVTDAAYLSGYAASSSFYRDAGAMLGMAPGDYRRGGMRQTIRFAVAECTLGSILVASTDRGVLRAAGRRCRGPGPGPAAALSAGRTGGRRCRIRAHRGPGRGPGRAAAPGPGTAAGCAGHGLPAARMAGAVRHSRRPDAELFGTGPAPGHAHGCPGRGQRRRGQPHCRGRALPPRGAQRRQHLRLPLGRGAQARPAAARRARRRRRLARTLGTHRCARQEAHERARTRARARAWHRPDLSDAAATDAAGRLPHDRVLGLSPARCPAPVRMRSAGWRHHPHAQGPDVERPSHAAHPGADAAVRRGGRGAGPMAPARRCRRNHRHGRCAGRHAAAHVRTVPGCGEFERRFGRHERLGPLLARQRACMCPRPARPGRR